MLKNPYIFTFIYNSASLDCFIFLASVIGVIILNIFNRLLKFSATKHYLGCFALLSDEIGTDADRQALDVDPAK
jgi:hypothetical protein